MSSNPTESAPPAATPEPVDENKLIAERRAKLASLREREPVPFPNDFRRDALAADVHAGYGALEAAALEAAAVRVRVAGRMMLRSIMGKASFARLQDSSGQIQVFMQKNVLGEVYDADAAGLAMQRTLDFFAEHLG